MIIDLSAEELAKDVLQKQRDTDKSLQFPIDPFALLKQANIHLLLSDFENLDGIIINDSDNITVVGINKNQPWTRQRFTAAHEYCHFLKDIKTTLGETNSIKCFRNSRTNIEKYANSFASALLMPIDELKKFCDNYKNADGFIDFESVTIIAEYFGVSFHACCNKIAYELKMIDGNIDQAILKQRIYKYGPSRRRRELIKNSIDYRLLANTINSLSYSMVNLNYYTGLKFIQNYIYYDNKIEGVEIPRDELNFILADLNYNGIDSKYFDIDKPSICMTLGNCEMQKFVINTTKWLSMKSCRDLHCLLYKFVPYPQGNGMFRTNDAIIRSGAIQPLNHVKIAEEIDKLDKELQFFITEMTGYSSF